MFVHNHSGNKKPTTHFCAIKSSLYFTYLYIHLILYFLQYKISLNNNYNWKSSICYTQVFYFWFWRTGGGLPPILPNDAELKTAKIYYLLSLENAEFFIFENIHKTTYQLKWNHYITLEDTRCASEILIHDLLTCWIFWCHMNPNLLADWVPFKIALCKI